MPAWWHDHDGRLFQGCLMCFYQGRLLRLTSSAGRPALVEAVCPNCSGLGYRIETGQACTEPVPLDDDEHAMARELAAAAGRCPDCLGYGQRIETIEDDHERTLISDLMPCDTCSSTGQRPDTPRA